MKITIVNRNIEQPLSQSLPRVEIIPDSAIIRDGKPFFVPSFSSSWQFEALIAFRSTRLGKNIAPKFAHRYYDAFALAVRTIPCDMLPTQSATSYAFDGSFIIGEWIDIDALNGHDEIKVSIGDTETVIKVSQLEIDATIARLSQFFTMKIGDIIVPAILNLSQEININTTLSGKINNITGECLKLKFK